MRDPIPATLAAGCLALALAALPARAQTAADTASVWTLQDENASISTSDFNDRYYTNGLRLSWFSTPAQVPDALASLGQTLWGAGEARVGIDITDQIYNPADTQAHTPPPGDHPYAGVLMANFLLAQDTATTRSTFGLGLGMVGPGTGGADLQNGFHGLIGQNDVNGWHAQLHNEPLLELLSERIWRLPMGTVGGLETDALPALTVGAGNLRIYAESGVNFRIGQGLDADFGPPRPRPGTSGGDVFRPTRDFGWYVFLGFDGQAVGHDLTIEGNTFQTSPHAKLYPWVAGFTGGLAVIVHGVRVTYAQVVETQEMAHQKGGLHQMGSLSASARF